MLGKDVNERKLKNLYNLIEFYKPKYVNSNDIQHRVDSCRLGGL